MDLMAGKLYTRRTETRVLPYLDARGGDVERGRGTAQRDRSAREPKCIRLHLTMRENENFEFAERGRVENDARTVSGGSHKNTSKAFSKLTSPRR